MVRLLRFSSFPTGYFRDGGAYEKSKLWLRPDFNFALNFVCSSVWSNALLQPQTVYFIFSRHAPPTQTGQICQFNLHKIA